MMYGVIQGVPKLAGKWDMLFVNGLGMSYNSGLYVYLIVLALVLVWGYMRPSRHSRAVVPRAICVCVSR